MFGWFPDLEDSLVLLTPVTIDGLYFFRFRLTDWFLFGFLWPWKLIIDNATRFICGVGPLTAFRTLVVSYNNIPL